MSTKKRAPDCERGGMEQSEHEAYLNIETPATGSDGI